MDAAQEALDFLQGQIKTDTLLSGHEHEIELQAMVSPDGFPVPGQLYEACVTPGCDWVGGIVYQDDFEDQR